MCHSWSAMPARSYGRPAGRRRSASRTRCVICSTTGGSGSGVGSPERVALVHDWLTGMRGGERCLEVLCELFPDAPLFTLLHVPGTVSPQIERRRIIPSFIQRLPGAASRYRSYLPVFPLAISRFNLAGYDLVVSMSHCVAK